MLTITQSIESIGRMSMNIRRSSKPVAKPLARITKDDYDYITEYLFSECSGYFSEVIPVGKDYEFNLNIEGRIEYKTVYCGSSPEPQEEMKIIITNFECRKEAWQDGKALPYIEGELVDTDFDSSRIHGISKMVYD